MQFIVDQFGIPYLIECNPRLGGGTYISTLAGVNCADIYFDLFQNKKPEAEEVAVEDEGEDVEIQAPAEDKFTNDLDPVAKTESKEPTQK